MEHQVAEVDIEIHLRWHGQPTTWEAGVEKAVRQRGQPRAHTKCDRNNARKGGPLDGPGGEIANVIFVISLP